MRQFHEAFKNIQIRVNGALGECELFEFGVRLVYGVSFWTSLQAFASWCETCVSKICLGPGMPQPGPSFLYLQAINSFCSFSCV